MSAVRPRVLTAVDPHLGGLLADLAPMIHDLYVEPGPYDGRVLLAPAPPATLPGAAAFGYNVSAFPVDEPTWTKALATALVREARGLDPFDLVHCPQLGAPINCALAEAFPHLPLLGIVRPADLQRAHANASSLAALRRDAHLMDVLAVPAGAYADALLALVPDLEANRLVSIPLPVPDHLIDFPPLYSRSSGRPRILYAGQTSDAAAIKGLLYTCKRAGVELTLAIASSQFDATREIVRTFGVGPTVLRDLTREELWELFGSIDAVAAPGPGPLAYSRTALEAQARGVPVICQIGSAMSEMLPGSVSVDFADPEKAAEIITSACADPALRTLRDAARSGAEVHRLSSIKAQLADLGAELRNPGRSAAAARKPLEHPPANVAPGPHTEADGRS
jgi:hypothetical protein